MKRTPLRPSIQPMKRYTPLPRRNAARYARRWTRAYGSTERARKIRQQPCIVPGCTARPSDNAHTETRRWATHADVFPVCRRHHRESHDIGLRSFAERYGIDPWKVAARLAEEIPV